MRGEDGDSVTNEFLEGVGGCPEGVLELRPVLLVSGSRCRFIQWSVSCVWSFVLWDVPTGLGLGLPSRLLCVEDEGFSRK